MERIRALLTESGFITEEDLDRLFTGQLSDIYALRTGALTERLTNGELTRVLIHLARRRGFKSNRREQSGDAEVDHIVPYSISFDDRMTNKVLVLTRENRNKGNRLPLQYLQGEARERFAVYTRQNVKNVKKRQNLLKPFLTEAEINAFKERNLQDTKTIARFMYNYINDHLLFAQSATGRKKHVHAVNGAATAYLRKRWGINKVRADGDLHHASDALVIACATDALIKRMIAFMKANDRTFMRSFLYIAVSSKLPLRLRL